MSDNMWSRYTMANVHTGDQMGEMAMSVAASPTVDMYCALPNGTECFCIEIAPFGVGMRAVGLFMDDAARQKALDWSREEGETHMPFALIVYILPDASEMPDDLGGITNRECIVLGMRHGTEGAPMFSESLLKSRFTENWDDTTYSAYVEAYKRGAQRRKGH